jgi:RpiB/LacA/LacB family sugar-phosphate isomerase
MRVAIASDRAGFALKEAVKAFLTAPDREVLDLGTHSPDPVDYSDYAEAVGRALRENRVERGILLCGSGVGASMAANKIPGIRAGLCHDAYAAHQGVEHDNMNVLVLGGRSAARVAELPDFARVLVVAEEKDHEAAFRVAPGCLPPHRGSALGLGLAELAAGADGDVEPPEQRQPARVVQPHGRLAQKR